ncbi:uncharacterized protein LOC132544791 [Ylistrum balloti]|uniref:uncharacterized protein LOC132544791 n=1 Tax=Ylistrum balloti TaxID=509963 RepID=UPI002905F3BD|nr:uncharacterized protein LOC132544791 [Ylistrum balloti]
MATVMAEMSEDSKKKRKDFENALTNEWIQEGVFERYDEPDELLRVRRAILHYICEGLDYKTEDFCKKVNKLINIEGTDIPRHPDVYKFEGDEEDQDRTDGRNRRSEIEMEIAVPHGTNNCLDTHDNETMDKTPQVMPGSAKQTMDQDQQVTPDSAKQTMDQDQQVMPDSAKQTMDQDQQVTPDSVKETMDKTPQVTCTIDKIGDTRLAFYIGVGEFDKRGIDGKSDGTGKIDEKMRRKSEEHMDRKNAESAFAELGFTFKSNKSYGSRKEEIDEFLEEVLKEAEEAHIIVVVIGSHGEEVTEQNKERNILRHRILLEDTFFYTDDLLKMFDERRKLKAIPKLFFIQACRGGVNASKDEIVDRGVPISVAPDRNPEAEENDMANRIDAVKINEDISDARMRLPKSITTQLQGNEDKEHEKGGIRQTKLDIDTTTEPIPQQEIQSINCIEESLVMHASASGREAYRKVSEGGWLITALCDGLKQWKQSNQDQDLLQVLTGVIGKIAIEKETRDGFKSAACFSHMLTKDIYL